MKNCKTLVATLLIGAAAIPASSQRAVITDEVVEYSTDKYKVETNHFWDNWFITAGAGAQVYFGDHDKQCDFGDRLGLNIDAGFGKWFTPGIGVRAMYSGLKIKGATKWDDDPNYDSAHGTGHEVPGKGAGAWYIQKSKYDMMNVHVDVLFNLSNLLCGYNENRVWNVAPYLGLGYGFVYEAPKAHDITANFGIVNSFRLCDALNLQLDVRGMIVHDDFDGEGGGRWGEGMLSASLGLTYRFKERGWGRSKIIYRYDNEAINQMRTEVERLSQENAALHDAMANRERDSAKIIVKRMASPCLVTFKIDKSKLSNEARVNLGLLAEVIKQGDSSAVYIITGYADAGTGSNERNIQLSKERAEAVRDCLVREFGVNSKQLRIDYKGGVDNMFYDDPRLSRAVITKGE